MSEITITTSDTPLRDFFASNSSTRMFFEKRGNDIVCKDPLTHEWFDRYVNEGGFLCISHGNGAFSNYYGIDPRPQYLGGGMGWDAVLAPPVNCSILKGDLCTPYTLNGQTFDFFWAHNALRNRMGASSYIIANILQGTIEQVYLQIDQLDQNIIYIQFGEETTDLWTSGVEYANKCYQWADALREHYPGQRFYFMFDCPMLWKKDVGTSAKAMIWANEIASVRPIDKSLFGIRQYCHLMYFINANDDTDHNIAEVENAITNLLPQYAAAIESSPFAGCKVFIGQISANEGAYTPEVNKGVQYFVNAYVRMMKFFTDNLRDDMTRFIGVCYIGTNSWIDKSLNTNLDFQYVGILNQIFGGGQKALYINQFDPMVDVIGTMKNGVYKIVMQNRKGEPVKLPETITLDGIAVPLSSANVHARKCAARDSTTSTDYNPLQDLTLSGYSIQCFQIKP